MTFDEGWMEPIRRECGAVRLHPLTAGLVVDLVDVATSAILGFVGLDALEIRRAAVAIWAGRLDGAANGAQR